MPPIFARHIQDTLLSNSSNRLSYSYGPVTLYRISFQRISDSQVTVERWSHHISCSFQSGIQFALCRVRSLLLTASRLISFPAGTKTLQFPAFPILADQHKAMNHIQKFPVQWLRAPRRDNIAACRVLHQRLSQDVHLIASVIFLYLASSKEDELAQIPNRLLWEPVICVSNEC